MDVDQSTPPYTAPNPPQPGGTQNKLKKAVGSLAVLGALLAKFKVAILAALKFLPIILKTGGTMFLSIWVYAMYWGWWFALGFVLLIFIHECGHLLVAKRLGLKVGAPVFIPVMGALISLHNAPPHPWSQPH